MGKGYLSKNHVTVDVLIILRIPLATHNAMLLGVIQPMSSAAGANEAHELIRFYPHDLFDTLVSPKLQQLTA